MNIIRWQPAYETGAEAIDVEHRELVRQVNRVYEAVRDKTVEGELRKVVAELIRYTEYHFANEEALMLQHGFVEMGAHQRLHRQLEGTVRLAQGRLESGEKGMGQEIFQFMRRWLLEHIVIEDKKVGHCISQGG